MSLEQQEPRLRPIPTPAEVEARLVKNTGLRDRVITVLSAPNLRSTSSITVKVQDAGPEEIAAVVRELEEHWRVTPAEASGAKVLVLSKRQEARRVFESGVEYREDKVLVGRLPETVPATSSAPSATPKDGPAR